MTLDEIKDQEVDATPEGQDLPEGNESNSPTPKHYTEEEYRKGLEDAIAQYGDRIKREKIDPIVIERDTFKSQVDQLTADVEDAHKAREDSENRIDELESDLATATEDNLDQKEIQAIKKSLREERKKAREEASNGRKANAELKRALEADREKWAGTVAEAQSAKFEVDVFEIAEGYVDAAGKPIESSRLKSLCEKAGQMKRSDIQEIADTLWTKRDAAPPMVTDSSVTSGNKTGKKPTLEELQSVTPAEYDKNIKSGKWVL